MHEEALFKDLRRKLLEIAESARTDRIVRVVLRVGALAHVSESAIRSRWTEVMADTPAERARLEVESLSDTSDPRATGIVLVEVDVDPGGPARESAAQRRPTSS
jgi:Zn finger protein HypA/HybF involved in hydrogenase expression